MNAYVIEKSNDFKTWEPVATVTSVYGLLELEGFIKVFSGANVVTHMVDSTYAARYDSLFLGYYKVTSQDFNTTELYNKAWYCGYQVGRQDESDIRRLDGGL